MRSKFIRALTDGVTKSKRGSNNVRPHLDEYESDAVGDEWSKKSLLKDHFVSVDEDRDKPKQQTMESDDV